MTGRPRRPGRWLRAQLRARVGLWVLFEWRNKVTLGPWVPALRRFENAEVERLRAGAGRPAARVAVVMPTYRRPELLQEAVASVLGQTFQDLVVIVVDDGAGLPELPQDHRLRAVSLSRNTGVLGLVRNVGIRLTSSAYLAFLDDDNTWGPRHLEEAVAALEAGAGIVYTQVERYRADGTLMDVLSAGFDRKRLSDEAYIDANSIVLRRTPAVLFSRLPRTRATLPKEDWEFMYRLSRTMPARHVPAPTVRYLVNDESCYSQWS
jgi:hypothetical protein